MIALMFVAIMPNWSALVRSIPDLLNSAPLIILPAPTTMAISVPVSLASPISLAIV